MILPSYSFIFIFLPIVVILYWIANGRRAYTAGKVVLLAASLYFYVFLTPGIKGLIALLSSAAFCYVIATFGIRKCTSPAARKTLLTAGIIINIALLIYCKYLDYIQQLIFGAENSASFYKAVVVPVGISYFTFSQIAYLVDTYRNPDMEYSILDYALFVSFFPKISVGPIALSTDLIPQFSDSSRKKIDYDNMAKGFYRFTLGLSKKLLLADNLGKFCDTGYANIPNLSSGDAILTILSYTLQIYFDFSGYCDLASGICLMLGIDLCENFDAPYRSLSVTEFWKRWHISLTTFFRNYLYIPMGGNRKGKIRTYFNNMFIFIISGLWHGAATHFVLWGMIHGIGIIISKLISPVTKKIPRLLRWILTFVFINLAWIFFRADSTGMAMDMIKRIFTGGFGPLNSSLIAACIPAECQLLQWLILKAAPNMTFYSGCAIWIALVALGVWLASFSRCAKERCDNFTASGRKVLTTVILFTWSVLSLSEVAEFIYVNF
ncbi:MAG: MBOAT family protein [Lachnospiraceae bacterium]|nr:MBOAT family protein [Lachnospiraceae bacterium]